jgi:D-amino-acid oxidase
MMALNRVLVIGCGVSGLSCGIRLLEAGYAVKLVAEKLPPHTTSNRAAAIWYPYEARPFEKVSKWGKVTLDELTRLAQEPHTGVSLVKTTELFAEPQSDFQWKDILTGYERAKADKLPEGYVDGFTFEIPVIETPIYMQYLVDRFQEMGGEIEQRRLASIHDVLSSERLTVNCAGLGAKEIVPGETRLYPIRGQIVRVRAPGVKQAWLDDYGPRSLAYIVPRSRDVILGGTAQKGDWNEDADAETSHEILRKNAEIDPALKNAEVIEAAVGLRPGRDEVRLELEIIDGGCAVIHNYGHGGAGFTLSWGCAGEVTGLAESYLKPK